MSPVYTCNSLQIHKSDTCAVPQWFECVHVRITEPNATAKVFTTGSMTVTGTKSLHDARLAVQKFCSIIQLAGFEVDQAHADAVSAGFIL
jgi:TATA-box binding protein (TBP) (component of TFIID and TFIIIB)